MKKSIIITEPTHTKVRLAAISEGKQIGVIADEYLAAASEKTLARAAKKAAKKAKP